jgi:hypothetical protein
MTLRRAALLGIGIVLIACAEGTSIGRAKNDAATFQLDAATPQAPQRTEPDGGAEPDLETDPEGLMPQPSAPFDLVDANTAVTSNDGGTWNSGATSDDGGTPDDASGPFLPEIEAGADAEAPYPTLDAGDANPAEMPRDASVGDPTLDAAAVADAGAELDAAPRSGKVVFATSAIYNAALGGPDGADAICATHASDAGLSGEFRAWLSSLTSDVATRLVHSSVPYVLTDGTVIALDWADLTDGTLLASINRDEFGAGAFGDVWTGTLRDGTAYPSNDCSGFTEPSAGSAQCGSASSVTSAWTENSVPGCSLRLRLYCFEQ